MNRQQRREQKRSRSTSLGGGFQAPPGYTLAVRQVAEAFQRWAHEHPNAELRFCFPSSDTMVIGPLDAQGIDYLAQTEDARHLLEYMDEASNHQATITMAVAVLRTGGEFSRMEIEKVSPFVCPYCMATLNAVTDCTQSGQLPEAGAMSICDVCAEIGVFVDSTTVRKLLPSDLIGVDPDELAQMEAYRSNLKASRGRPTS